MKNWSIIIFCYNEEHTIAQVIRDAYHFLKNHAGKGSEIILINDGSSDNTLNNAQNLTVEIPILKIYTFDQNKGIGNALNRGYDLAQCEYVCAIPGDGQFDIQELYEINYIPEKSFIAFYRPQKNYSLYRSILTWGNYIFNKIILGVSFNDVNWVKIYTREQLNSISRELNSSLVESEIVAKLICTGYQPLYFPSKYLDRKDGIAKGGSTGTLLKAVREIFYLRKTIEKHRKTERFQN